MTSTLFNIFGFIESVQNMLNNLCVAIMTPLLDESCVVQKLFELAEVWSDS